MARRTPRLPTVTPSPVVGTPGTIVVAPTPAPIAGGTWIPDNPATGVPGHYRIGGRRSGSPIVGQAVPRGTAIGLDVPVSTLESGSAAVQSALEASARQRKRAAGGSAASTPLVGGAATPILSVRGLVGA